MISLFPDSLISIVFGVGRVKMASPDWVCYLERGSELKHNELLKNIIIYGTKPFSHISLMDTASYCWTYGKDEGGVSRVSLEADVFTIAGSVCMYLIGKKSRHQNKNGKYIFSPCNCHYC
jgi:hypothetical protein